MAAWEAALDGGMTAEESGELLRRRARRLAAPAADAAPADTVDAVVFAYAGSRFGVRIEQVATVITADGLLPVPGTPPTIGGIVNHRAQVLAVIDLAAYFGLTSPAGSEGARLIVVVEGGGRKFGVLAERPVVVEAVEAGRIVPAAAVLMDDGKDALGGVTATLVTLLDADHLASDQKVTVNHDGT